MDSIVARHLRSGVVALSICGAMILGGALIASAQSATPQDDPTHQATQPSSPSSAVPATTQTAPATMDQDKQAQPASPNQEARESSKTERKEMTKDVKEFDKFLDSHPQIDKELQQDPQKVNDAAWVSQHAELEKWLNDHPSVREELKENPARFMKREKQYDKNEAIPKK